MVCRPRKRNKPTIQDNSEDKKGIKEKQAAVLLKNGAALLQQVTETLNKATLQ